jgi:hypothetical protein
MSKQPLNIRRLAIVPTLRCTLNCKLCSNHMPMFKKKYDIPLENMKRDIDHIFELVDHIEWLQFVGGEIFMVDYMADVYEYALKYKSQFDKLILMTNATIAPRAKEISVLKKYGNDCEIMISDYGKYSYKTDEMVDICKENDIPYTIKCYHGDMQYYGGWIDNTSLKKCSEDMEVIAKQRARCSQVKMKNMHCMNGKIHRCSNSCFLTELGVNKPSYRDFVDLNDDSVSKEEKIEIIRNFYKEPVESCKICSFWNIENGKRYPAAEQM